MIHTERWYREALFEEGLVSVVRAFERQPSWETFQPLLYLTGRLDIEIPHGVFQVRGVDWYGISKEMKEWMKAYESVVVPDYLSSFWLMLDSAGHIGWPLDVPAWFITRSHDRDVPPVNVTSLYGFTWANFTEELEYGNLGFALEMGWYRPVDGGHEPIVTHTLTDAEGNPIEDPMSSEGTWVVNRPIPLVSDYPVQAMSLKTLLRALQGYESEGGIWVSERRPPEDVASRYPSIDGHERLFIALEEEKNWQIRDAEIQAWMDEL